MARRDLQKRSGGGRSQRNPGRFDPLLLINGTLVGISGVFLATASVAVTLAAAGTAVMLAVVALVIGR